MEQDIESVINDIRSIKIQGATNIAKASIGALLSLSERLETSEPSVYTKEIKGAAERLAWARPDEPLDQNLLKFLTAKLEKEKNEDVGEMISSFRRSAKEVLEMIAKNEALITDAGTNLIKKIHVAKNRPVNIFTHCNSSSVFRILAGAHSVKIPLKVYNCETRPKYQGRIMAENLAKSGINVTMMTDSTAPFVISKNDPDNIDIDIVILGADVVSKDGAILNKIGSYSLALAAKNSGVPLYSATTLLKIGKDIGSFRDMKIEKRDPSELGHDLLKELDVLNFAFDTVPPEYITGLVTEFGILRPDQVGETAEKEYKEFLFSDRS